MNYTCKHPNPYGIKNSGNIYFASSQNLMVRPFGLGSIRTLSDEMLLYVLNYCTGKDLGRLCISSRILYVYSHHFELWRDLVLQQWNGVVNFYCTWRDTFVRNICQPKYNLSYSHKPIAISGVYSEILYRPWCCSMFDFESACPGIYDFNDIPKLDGSILKLEDFINDFEIPNRPVILTNIVTEWKAFHTWTNEYLLRCCKDTKFRATSTTAPFAATFTMDEYFTYQKHCLEEAPFYLFDRDYTNIEALQNDYNIPPFFDNNKNPNADLFSLLGERKRPDYRWLIIGPARSGSIFHIDPNQTSAWNASIKGRKKWIFYPPGISPPGVRASENEGDVIVPLTTGEWLLSFWKFHLEERNNPDLSKRPLEVIMQPGELIFVPHNWWHMVINLDDCIALTHNYVSKSNLPDCLRFLREKSDHISGVRDRPDEAIQPEELYKRFIAILENYNPEMYQSALNESMKPLKRIRSIELKKNKKKKDYKHDSIDCKENISFLFNFTMSS
jgi:hypothetical protein